MHEIATLAGGCFWCLEAVYDQVPGVISVESGYMGGHTDRPDYDSVCSGQTGHAEVVRIAFNPAAVQFKRILEIFFAIHDPTTLNRQGNDVGTQYRSAIFAHSPEQELIARGMIQELAESHAFDAPIVTEVAKATQFWVAEDYHQTYFARNPHQPYCAVVITPKLAKFRAWFKAQS